ncbi:MAG TPA: hypothetical protein VN238_15585, partial [Solirubrobacteraceae bacterium]|nr:hypothetical protein [Solirubrobacteraceae bacterium]
MSLRRLALATLALTASLAAPALAHEGNPDFESKVTKIDGIPGLKAEILNGDDRLLVVYSGSEPLVIEGYKGEPYVRIEADGTVEVNTRSEATYLNDDRFGEVKVPAIADVKAEPEWKAVGKGGRFEFHDHRMHWMSKTDPPLEQDRGERQKVFDWSVPVKVEGAASAGAVRGTLWWRGDGGGAPVAMFAGLGVFVVLALAFVFVVRRRRGDGEPAEAGAP